MLLSVILPVYNAEKYLRQAIESVLTQSYFDFELIIINDGSIDKSPEVIGSFYDSRIVLIDRENRGLASSLNEGIHIARGKYIARMDADDICLPNRFQEQISFLESNPDVGLVGSGVEVIDEEGKHLAFHVPYTGSDILVHILYNEGNPFKHPSVIFRKDVVLSVGGYNETINKYFEDYFLWIQIAKISKLENIPDILLKYRISANSIMSGVNKSLIEKFVKEIVKKDVFDDIDMIQLEELVKESRTQNDKSEIINKRKKIRLYDSLISSGYFVLGDVAISLVSRLKKIYYRTVKMK